MGGTAVQLSPPSGPLSPSSPSDDVAPLLQAVRDQQSGRQLRPVLANSTSVGMQPDVGVTPVPQVGWIHATKLASCACAWGSPLCRR